MTRLFISYSHVDRWITDKIAAGLRRTCLYIRYRVWYDPQLAGGQRWWDEIRTQIAACDVFICLISPEWVASSNCQDEYNVAVSFNKRILPVLVRARTQIPAQIAALQYVDLSQDPGGPNGVRQMHESVAGLTGQNPRCSILPFAVVLAIIVIALFMIWQGHGLVTQGTPSFTAVAATSTPTITSILVVSTAVSTVVPTPITPTATVGVATLASNNLSTLTIQRGIDSIAICTESGADLSNVQLRISADSYRLGNEFAASQNTAAGQCWCLQQKNIVPGVLPAVCTSNNTTIEPNTGADWRNATLRVSRNGTAVGSCDANKNTRDPYSCPLR